MMMRGACPWGARGERAEKEARGMHINAGGDEDGFSEVF